MISIISMLVAVISAVAIGFLFGWWFFDNNRLKE
jgi:high-affinity Fe2+/Pb2+ permease